MFKSFKNTKPKPLLISVFITLLYPTLRAISAPINRLQLFTDAVTYTSLGLMFFGIFYSMVLHGDHDIGAFTVSKLSKKADKQSFKAFMENQREKRADAFNYPLFLGVVYFLVSIVIAYCFL